MDLGHPACFWFGSFLHWLYPMAPVKKRAFAVSTLVMTEEFMRTDAFNVAVVCYSTSHCSIEDHPWHILQMEGSKRGLWVLLR
jgi:hypothetical protein